MKKTALIFLFAFASFVAQAQGWQNPLPIDSASQRVSFTGVVQVPGATKAELYSRAREWFANNFGSSKAVLEMDDREIGKLIGRAYEPFGWEANVMVTLPSRLWRTIKVEVKDGRYRYTITNFNMAMGAELESSAKPVEMRFVKNVTNFKSDNTPRNPVLSVIEAVQASSSGEVASLKKALAGKKEGDF